MSNNDSSERRPLLSSPPTRNDFPESISVPPLRSEDLPQANPASNLLACLVCGSMIDISNKKDHHVVKCSNCNEATPLREAPSGRRFVRCPCNCLLVFNLNAYRISCPRSQCRRVIFVSQDSPDNSDSNGAVDNPMDSSVQGLNRIECAHCGGSFFFSSNDNCPARCPHCRKLSTIDKRFSCTRGIIFLVLAFVFLSITLGVLFGTLPRVDIGDKGYIALDIFLGLLFLYFFYRSVSYFTMKVSRPILSSRPSHQP